MAGAGLGQLGLWLHLRGRRNEDPALPAIPAGDGPALVLHVSADALQAEAQILRRLARGRADLRVIRLADDPGAPDRSDPTRAPAPDLAHDPVRAARLLDLARPGALLLLGSDLPPALIAAAQARQIPMVLAEFRLGRAALAWGMRASMRRQLLSHMTAILLRDAASHHLARRMGLPAARLTMTGPVSEIREPLYCSETERVSMAQQMNGRHAWFAAGLPPSEEAAVLAAHEAALRHSHRALLILAPRDAARIDALAGLIETAGLTVARRSEDEDFGDEVQVLLTDGPTEMGLWYRLAPVSFMGGTLEGEDSAMRHPFEPAALGSAIVHGPQPGPYRTEWQHLDGAHAARQVRGPEELAQAVTELTQPELIAALASNAWKVSTGGAEVAIRIAEQVLRAMDRPMPAGRATA